MKLHDAAESLTSSTMAGYRKVSIKSGHDPAEFALYAYGGAAHIVPISPGSSVSVS